MTYRYKFSPPIRNVEECSWFNETYETISDWQFRDVDDVDKEYEKKFNVKFIYGDIEEDTSIRKILAIEFPSEEEATLFFLRWT